MASAEAREHDMGAATAAALASRSMESVAPKVTAVRTRLQNIDALRGLVMVLMLLDHTRETWFLQVPVTDPVDARTILPAIAFAKLTRAGFAAVDLAGSCTICTPASQAAKRYKYTSFRRNSLQRALDPTHPGISGRNQQSGIIILPASSAG